MTFQPKTGDTLYLIGAHGETATPVASALPQAAAAERQATEAVPNAAASSDPRPLVRTFDVFDTLIARRCIEPSGVFAIIEERSGLKGFAAARRKAEAHVLDRPHDLDVIYAELARLLGVEPVKLAALKALEVDVEKEQVIPIAENLARVRHGDVLISDMYLGATHIRSLLDRAGLTARVGLVVTNDGKKTGRIWPDISANLRIEEHLGDNEHSDVKMPTSFGLTARLTRLDKPSAVETVLINLGLRQLAELCREARLRTFSEDAGIRTVQLIQANLNFPLMLMASIELANLVRHLGLRRVLFSSRDCDMWVPLFEEVARRKGVTCKAEYFYTSRLAKMQPSESYLAYARDRIGQDSIVVDLCGTGWSLSHLAERLGLSKVPVFFLHKLPSAKAYEELSQTPDACAFHALIRPDAPDVFNTILEMCNYSDHGMVRDVRMVEGFALPVLAEDERGAADHAAVRAQKETFALAVSLMKHFDLNHVLQLDQPSISAVSTALYQSLSRQQSLRGLYGKSHMDEEVRVRRQIGCN
ncbi:hypothetical protein [Rhizobium straminoryzae]|uniref:HAD family hydrolase n=1 Tax=Rhizobium straminoryzae TaxID=1387186 RepID=A0A549TIC5_9HYPH|nr:hypothetical protein [Rhizobium straminoryzae]TRL43004.1 hypothetical protein FNA46_00905 [Rhizobium straminoryzae]